MTLIISVGRWGGFYLHPHRLCLGWIAFTFYGKDYDDLIEQLIYKNTKLSNLLHHIIDQLKIATDLGEKRWKALNSIYVEGERRNTNWCKRKAGEGLGIK